MTEDFRVTVNIQDDLKIQRFVRETGPEGFMYLMYFWAWVSRHRPDGDLSAIKNDDIEIVLRCTIDNFACILKRHGFIDGEEGSYQVHDWEEHNPWVSDGANRKDKSRLSTLCRFNSELHGYLKDIGIEALTKKEYEVIKRMSIEDYRRYIGDTSKSHHRPSNAVCPSPSPSPSPSPKERESAPAENPIDFSIHPDVSDRLEGIRKRWNEIPHVIKCRGIQGLPEREILNFVNNPIDFDIGVPGFPVGDGWKQIDFLIEKVKNAAFMKNFQQSLTGCFEDDRFCEICQGKYDTVRDGPKKGRGTPSGGGKRDSQFAARGRPSILDSMGNND